MGDGSVSGREKRSMVDSMVVRGETEGFDSVVERRMLGVRMVDGLEEIEKWFAVGGQQVVVGGEGGECLGVDGGGMDTLGWSETGFQVVEPMPMDRWGLGLVRDRLEEVREEEKARERERVEEERRRKREESRRERESKGLLMSHSSSLSSVLQFRESSIGHLSLGRGMDYSDASSIAIASHHNTTSPLLYLSHHPPKCEYIDTTDTECHFKNHSDLPSMSPHRITPPTLPPTKIESLSF